LHWLLQMSESGSALWPMSKPNGASIGRFRFRMIMIVSRYSNDIQNLHATLQENLISAYFNQFTTIPSNDGSILWVHPMTASNYICICHMVKFTTEFGSYATAPNIKQLASGHDWILICLDTTLFHHLLHSLMLWYFSLQISLKHNMPSSSATNQIEAESKGIFRLLTPQQSSIWKSCQVQWPYLRPNHDV
jgi:hypothetical protein